MKLWKKTPTSHLYLTNHRGKTAVLKKLTDLGVGDEKSGIDYILALQGNPSCVMSFNHDHCSLLMEYLTGPNLYVFSKNNKEDEASKIFVKIIKDLHQVEFEKKNFKPLSYLFQVWERVLIPENLKKDFQRAKELSLKLQEGQTHEVLLHGDLHHENILARENGHYVCIDPKGFYGDPAYELGTVLKNPWDYPEISQNPEHLQTRAKYFSKELNLPLERIYGFTFIHLILSIAWAIEDGESYNHQLKVLKALKTLF